MAMLLTLSATSLAVALPVNVMVTCVSESRVITVDSPAGIPSKKTLVPRSRVAANVSVVTLSKETTKLSVVEPSSAETSSKFFDA